MNYPIVYDKMDTTYEGFGLAILENSKDVYVFEEINGKHTLELILPRDDPKWAYIQTENQILVDGHLYIIRSTDEQRNEDGSLRSNIQCEHIFFELLDEYIIHEEMINVTAQHALDIFLAGTRFKPNAFTITGTRDLEVEDCTPVEAINNILSVWKCEVQCAGLPDPDGKFLVTLRNQIGVNSGVQFRYAKNNKSIRKTTDSRGVVTRLYVFGKDGLGIESAAANYGGMPYIDSPNIGNYRAPKKASKHFNDIEDPDELYQAGLDYLATIDVPKVSYEVDVVELKRLSDFGVMEAFSTGDEVRIIDEELGIDIYARIVSYGRYPYEPRRSRVALANFRPGIEDFFNQLDDARRVVEAVTSKKKVLTSAFEAFARQAIFDVMNSKTEIIYPDTGGLLLRDTDDPNDQVLLKAKGIVVSEDGGQTTKAAITGRGVVAEAIIGILGDFAQVRTDQLIAGDAKISSALIESIKTTQIVIGGAGELIGDSLISGAGRWNGRTTLINDSGIYTGTLRANQIVVGGAGETIGDALISGSGRWNNRTTLINESGIYTGQVTTNQLVAGSARIGSALIDTIKANQIDVSTGRIIASQIDATNLHVHAANIDGTITAGAVVAGISISGPTITGGIIQTAATGRRIVLSGSQLQSLNSSTKDGFTLDGASGFLLFHTNGSVKGNISRRFSGANEQLQMYHDNNVGIGAGSTVFFDTPRVQFQPSTLIDFANANISGLNVVAKFG